jgi:hypothetical protein
MRRSRSWVSQHFDDLPQKKCFASGKVMYDKRGAQTVKNTIYDKERLRLRIYQCPDCDTWHLTSKLTWN